MQQKPRHIMAYAAGFCKGFRITQVRNFARLCWAIFLRRTTVISELARAFKRPRRHSYRLKRMWRFLSNPRFNFQAVMDAVCLYNLAMALAAGACKAVLIDITFLSDGLAILAAALAWQGRAIPVCMWAFQRDNPQRSQNTLTHQMLAHLKGLLGSFVVVGDRGFGHSWTIECCLRLGLHFVLRIRDEVLITAGGRRGPAKSFLPPSDGRRFYPNALYHGQKKLRVNFIAIRKGRATWLLVTSLSDFRRAVRLYEQRMQIEETFRDFKSTLGLSRLRLRGVGRLQVMLVALMVVYSFLFRSGVVLARSEFAKALAASGTEQLSYPSLALILIDTYPLLLRRLIRRLGRYDDSFDRELVADLITAFACPVAPPLS